MIEDQRSFANTVKDVGKNKEISKIIIDVRNNNGGNDLAWKYIVEAIISDSIKDFAVTAVLNSSKIKERPRKPPVSRDLLALMASWKECGSDMPKNVRYGSTRPYSARSRSASAFATSLVGLARA